MKLLSTSAIVLAMASVPAFAGDQTDVDQVLFNLQTALNTLTNGHDVSGVSQAATNAGNIISTEDTTLDDVMQLAISAQLAQNIVYSFGGDLSDIDQAATNVVNSISMGGDPAVANDIRQATILVPQVAYNEIGHDFGGMNKVTQDAVNAANVASVGDINEGIGQYWVMSAQSATNLAYGGGYFTRINKLDQTATNVANSVSAATIAESDVGIEALQIAAGVQVADNDIEFRSGCIEDSEGCNKPDLGLSNSSQTALNAANIISVENLNGISDQSATLAQLATNDAYYTGLETGWDNGQVKNLTQSATNAANILSVSGEVASIEGLTEMTQTSTSLQLATNTLYGDGSISNVTQAATNVANSISIGVPES